MTAGSTAVDPVLERQVETIRNLVDSYLGIGSVGEWFRFPLGAAKKGSRSGLFLTVSKSLKDQVPKCCMHMMVNNFKDFVKDELLACLYRDAKVDQLMEESAVESQRRQELLNMYQTSKEALRIIGEINQGTVVRLDFFFTPMRWMVQTWRFFNALVRAPAAASRKQHCCRAPSACELFSPPHRAWVTTR